MKIKPFNSMSCTTSDRVSEKSECLPSIVNNIAVRLAWVTQRTEADVLALLSLPFHHNAITAEDLAVLQTHFPFMQQLNLEMTQADFTILLVMIWIRIETMYRQGIVLPTQIVYELMQTNDNHVST